MSQTVLLLGNPNSGKTTLFNALTGASARVGNYPGITVERRVGRGRGFSVDVDLVDLPGTYSLTARSDEERVAIESLLGTRGELPAAVVVVLDATSLRRGLYLALQCLELAVPTVLALTLADEARGLGLRVDAERLAELAGCPVVPVAATKGEGLAELRAAVEATLANRAVPPSPVYAESSGIARALDEVVDAFGESAPAAGRARALGRTALLADASTRASLLPPAARAAAERALGRLAAEGVDVQLELVGARYAVVDAFAALLLDDRPVERTRTDRLDRVLTHPVWGGLVFAAVMGLLFEALFRGSEPMVGLVETVVTFVQGLVRATLPDGLVEGLLVDGIVAGVGNVIVFVPQIALLFLFVTLLEDSGYLARVAFVIDRLMAGVGLHGKAFVPLLSGFACAVPAILSTRTLENKRDRLVTMLALPFMSCSARLPVYVLVVATLVPDDAEVFGFVSVGALVLFSLYVFSVLATLFAAFLLRRTVLPGPRPTLVLELPPYRAPQLRNVVRAVWDRVRTFLVEAGTTILALTVVLWAALTFPRSPEVDAQLAREVARVEASVPAGEARDAAVAEAESRAAQQRLERSALGRVGRAIEPALAPLGFDWRIDVGILGAFAAREVFVSTLGIVFGLGETDEESEPLRTSLRTATRRDGSKLFDVPTGASLLVFFVLACQCMSTVAVVRRESGGWRWALFMVAYMTAFAYVGALVARLVAMQFVHA